MQKPVKKNISIRLHPATQKALEKLAWAEKRARSAMIGFIVSKHLQERGHLKSDRLEKRDTRLKKCLGSMNIC